MTDDRRARAVDLGITGDANPFQEVTVDHLFGDIWNRPGLDYRERRLLIIGVIAAFGREELAELQFYSALSNGELTVEQVNEIALHLTHYVGFALGSVVNGAAQRAIERYENGEA
jgi:4-carboxymuconolactone decarboxylase